MKTEFWIETPTEDMWALVLKHLYAHGYKWCGSEPSFPTHHEYEERNIVVDETKTIYYNATDRMKEDFKKLSFCELLEFLNSPTEVILNPDYKALVDHKTQTVTVGCQTFDFSAIRNLAKEVG